ncbi:Creatininase [Thauera humireducens]|uniref:creatininase family protein n=1 Tax=Thauera humireducens TaxID=1134435 RepID=UPI002467A1C5|nr:creatininase family protein [Thauera humireducens]CAH1749132.1 Creatininase [Thauera humireducens]
MSHPAERSPAIPWWQDRTPREIAALAAADGVALLPLAAIEQHGEHLPLSTDLDIALGLIEAALPRVRAGLPVCVLPPLAVGLSLEHCAFAGTLSLSPETALAVIVELGERVAAAGFRRLVLFNSHGGNKALVDLAALKLRAAQRMLVVRANYFRFAPPPDVLPADELRHGLHGGALETAMMLHLAPAKVRMDGIAHFDSLGREMAREGRLLGPEGEAGFAWMAQDLNAGGATGDARLATPALGARLVEHFAGQLARLIEDAHAFDLARLADGPLDGAG